VIEEKGKQVTYVDGKLHTGPLVPPPTGNVETKSITTANAIASPGLFGTWPMIDYCRGYTYIVFVKNLLGEERADAHLQLKKIVDAQTSSSCK